ncbi:Wzz/FepE/Etk N-terminal domain-containing protein [Pseudoalteromonas spongiae]|uniref:Wzz/FepE/Etk N-terminal domain-containing protein n=1 Tax=Pseudoalteromonas spongiae TaxID=298657 RepID=UPI0037358B4F
MNTANNIQEVSITDLVLALWQQKLKISFGVILFAVASVFYALSLPNMYRSTVTTVPAESNGSNTLSSIAGQFGGLASLAGVNLGGNDSNLTITLETMKSREFLTSLIETYDLKKELFAIESWSYLSKEYTYDQDVFDIENNLWVREVPLPKVSEPSLLEAYIELKKEFLNIQHDPKTNVITINVTHYSPYFAQELSSNIVKEINLKMKRNDIEEADKSIKYLKEMIDETSVSKLREVFFTLIEQQEQKRMLASIQKEYALKVIDPAVVAEEKTSPKRASIVILGCVFGFLVSIFIIYLESIIRKK